MFNVLNKSPTIPETLSSEGKDFLQWCFQRNPADRPSAAWLLDHPFLQSSHVMVSSHEQDFLGGMQEFSRMKVMVSSKSQPCMSPNICWTQMSFIKTVNRVPKTVE